MPVGQEVRVHLDGPPGAIELSALLEAGRSLMALLSRPDSESRWVVSGLSLGSVDLAIRPTGVVTREDDELIHELDRELTELAAPDHIPARWDRNKTNALLRLARLVGTSHVSEVTLSIGDHLHVIDEQIERNLEQSLAEPEGRSSLGSVRGIVKRYNGNKREVGIVDRRTGRAIPAGFSASITEKVASEVEREVVAWGEVTRDAAGRIAKLQIRDLEHIDLSPPPEPVERLVGIYGPDWTDGVASEDWIRRQRDR